MADRLDALTAVVEPALAALGLELVDVELAGAGRGRTLRISVDRDGGVDLDTIATATEAVSPRIDALVGSDALAGPYTLEVSSPGLERPLRTPAHFRRVVGSVVTVKSRDDAGRRRRDQGVLVAVDDDAISLDVAGTAVSRRFDEVLAASTVFEWKPTPKPGGRRPTRSDTP